VSLEVSFIISLQTNYKLFKISERDRSIQRAERGLMICRCMPIDMGRQGSSPAADICDVVLSTEREAGWQWR
jgi:hypothetical protein